jgi:hypothetical protein
MGDLCLRSGLPALPKDDQSLHILLKSAALLLDPSAPLTEKDVNEKLDVWVRDISRIENMDFVTMRRALVDAGYLIRDSNGSTYRVAVPDPRPGLFEESISQLNIFEVVETAREEIARRKQEYLARANPK